MVAILPQRRVDSILTQYCDDQDNWHDQPEKNTHQTEPFLLLTGQMGENREHYREKRAKERNRDVDWHRK